MVFMPGNETTLKFSSDTTGVAYSAAPSTINATVSEVPYEADTTNNSLTTTILVKMPATWAATATWVLTMC